MKIVEDNRRCWVSFVTFSAAIFLLAMIFTNRQVFLYLQPRTEYIFGDWPRALWSIMWGLFGFTSAAFTASFHKHEYQEWPNPKFYLWYSILYGMYVLFSSILCFVLFDALKQTNAHLFYFATAVTSLYLGHRADPDLLEKLVSGMRGQ